MAWEGSKIRKLYPAWSSVALPISDSGHLTSPKRICGWVKHHPSRLVYLPVVVAIIHLAWHIHLLFTEISVLFIPKTALKQEHFKNLCSTGL